MVDFDKLRKQRSGLTPIEPTDIFLRLAKAPGLDDLWSSQSESLKEWFKRRNERDLVIKLNTGGGKTLVGLLIAQSTLNERKGPVLYLCATVQLQTQTLEKSKEYGIPAVPYVGGQEISEDFLSGKAIMVSTYHALFNGLSKFGIAGRPERSIDLQGIILDDAHTAFSNMRDIFSLSVSRSNQPDLYDQLTNLFRADFAHEGRQGTFDDIVAGEDHGILEVPYISWGNRADEIRLQISTIAQDDYPFVWPLIRDHFDLCHALISKDEFTITPLMPIVNLFPSFSGCDRRIYMSATVADDSSIIRTFDADQASVSEPIAPTSLAGVGERMILAPELMRLGDIEELTKAFAKRVSESRGVVILAPSTARAETWSDVATVAQGNDVLNAVDELVARTSNGPFVFPNRYDGIDLPGDSCRFLVLIGLPRSNNIYDLFRATVLEGSGLINTTLAQRVEQGMGRGTRGGGDHCVVILVGKDLVGWISRAANMKLLTSTTQVQLGIGIEVSREITNVEDLTDTIKKCLNRSVDWTEYHANALADATGNPMVDESSLDIAAAERRYFDLALNGYYEKAAGTIEKFAQETKDLDPKMKGWLLELGARAAHLFKNLEKREKLQQEAYFHNKNVHRPTSGSHYEPLKAPTRQAERVCDYLEGFALIRGALVNFEGTVDLLVSAATSNQFEEAMKNFGEILGYSAERPERTYGVGPDVLWLLDKKTALIIEAKSRKQANNALTKIEHGQLLQAVEWFEQEYKDLNGLRVIVHPNSIATKSVTVGSTYALTMPKLGELIGAARTLLNELTEVPVSRSTLVGRCEKRLEELQLNPSGLVNTYLDLFVSKEV